MEEPKERDLMTEISNRTTNSSSEDKKEEIVKLIQLMSVTMICIYQEICKQKEDEDEINKKLMWCSGGEKHIESKKQEIRYHEHSLGKVMEPELPIRSIPRTDGYLPLTQKDAQETPVVVDTDRKRCHNRLKKERTDFEYLEQVQEELLSLKKSDGRTTIGGTQELNDVMEGLVHRIQHGNNNRAKETKFFHEIQKLEETREKYAHTEELRVHDCWNGRVIGARQGWTNRNKATEHKIKILLKDIKEAKMDRMGHTTRAILLKAELEQVRKNIKCMEREVEKITSKTMKAYKCAYELQEQRDVLEIFMRQWSSGKVFSDDYKREYKNVDSNTMKELGEERKEKSSGSDYQSFMIYVKKLIRGGDVVALKKVCDKKVGEFLRQWSNTKM